MDPAKLALASAITASLMALVALASAIVGPWVALTIARRQIQANVVSGNRLRWIERLRDETSHFLALVNVVGISNEGYQPLLPEPKAIEYVEQILSRKAVIELLLNPNEKEHNDFLTAVNNLTEHCLSGDAEFGKSQRHELSDQVLRLAKPIMKIEWERVKSLT